VIVWKVFVAAWQGRRCDGLKPITTLRDPGRDDLRVVRNVRGWAEEVESCVAAWETGEGLGVRTRSTQSLEGAAKLFSRARCRGLRCLAPLARR
jgi:hypothetical protein